MRGNGTKIMLLAEGHLGVPVALLTAPSNLAESALLEPILASRHTIKPRRINRRPGLRFQGFVQKARTEKRHPADSPHKKNRTSPSFQDGRCLRRYRSRWPIERTNAWLQNFRRVTVRYDWDVNRYIAFCTIACALMTLKQL